MPGAASTRSLFLVAVGLIAAAIADPIVESIANSGIVGGHYRDDNHITVIPALLGGGIFALAALALRCRDAFRSTTGAGDWLARLARNFSDRSPSRDLPSVFLVQLLALFSMESAEQLVVGGHLLGGTVWLGGPILLSLLAQALVGAACLRALGSFMRALLGTLASLVRTVLRFVWLSLIREMPSVRCRRVIPPSLRHQWDAVRYSCGRAPPLLHAPV